MREYTEIEKVRLSKMEALRARGEEPYPNRVHRTHTVAEAAAAYEAAIQEGTDTHDSGVAVTLCGRIRSIRTMGKSAFAHVEDGAGKLQLYIRADEVGAEALKTFEANYDLGDFLQAEGVMFKTKTGELSLRVKSFRMLAKGISPLPAAKEQIVDGERKVYSAFDNPEARYRERYADLAVNPEVRDIFRTRAQMISSLRRFLDANGFLEVETPILQPLYGGAHARPFTTMHNTYDQMLYLRISFELYLKRLVIGGLDRVYEIGRDFRNEGVSKKHNPEFTMLEVYQAYADFEDMMALTEQLVAHAAERTLGTTRLGRDGQTLELAPPWPRLKLADLIREHSGVDILRATDLEALRAAVKEARVPGVEPGVATTWAGLVDDVFSETVEPKLVQPTFVIEYPAALSPLAKREPGRPQMVERFEPFIGGMEIGNAFSELNDPDDQRARFLDQADAARRGDLEAEPLDEDFLRALEYGMPPTGGLGVGIGRLAMILTGASHLREVKLFPHLRPRDD